MVQAALVACVDKNTFQLLLFGTFVHKGQHTPSDHESVLFLLT